MFGVPIACILELHDGLWLNWIDNIFIVEFKMAIVSFIAQLFWPYMKSGESLNTN